MEYTEFLKNKVAIAPSSGFEVDRVNPAAFPHQADSIKWALRGGRRAIFAAFGNGKTIMGLELAYQCALHTGKQSLIICPLGVKQEFAHDAEKLLGYMAPTYVRTQAEVQNCDNRLMITNYERVRDGDIDVAYFGYPFCGFCYVYNNRCKKFDNLIFRATARSCKQEDYIYVE